MERHTRWHAANKEVKNERLPQIRAHSYREPARTIRRNLSSARTHVHASERPHDRHDHRRPQSPTRLPRRHRGRPPQKRARRRGGLPESHMGTPRRPFALLSVTGQALAPRPRHGRPRRRTTAAQQLASSQKHRGRIPYRRQRAQQRPQSALFGHDSTRGKAKPMVRTSRTRSTLRPMRMGAPQRQSRLPAGRAGYRRHTDVHSRWHGQSGVEGRGTHPQMADRRRKVLCEPVPHVRDSVAGTVQAAFLRAVRPRW